MSSDLRQLEREVEAARAKLAADLNTLRSPDTVRDFADELKTEAMHAKDALMDKASTAATSFLKNSLETIKAKAAENPAAILAIGAGLAWRIVQHPPIASALVGAGVYSLFRTAAHGRSDFSYAQKRLQAQAADLAEGAQEQAKRAADVMKDRAKIVTNAAGETMQQWTSEAGTALSDLKEQLVEKVVQAPTVIKEATQAAIGIARSDQIRSKHSLSQETSRLGTDNRDTRDTLLLGTAGLAVAAAVSIAFQRRSRAD